MVLIENANKWNEYAEIMEKMGHKLYVMQHDIDDPEGFHALFVLDATARFEVVTHSKDVYEAIMEFSRRGRQIEV